jgi:serine/threonine protein kinase/class 3 adenylate cyclase
MNLGGYRVLSQLGAGQDGVSYRALAPDAGSLVEVRDLSGARADPIRWPLVVKRLRLAARLEHPVAIRIRELGLDHDPPYLAQEWAGGVDLAAALPDGRPLNVPAALTLAHTLAVALKAAHRLGLAHGQLNPSHLHGPSLRDPKLDFSGLAVHSDLGQALFREVDASCRAPEAGGDGSPDRAADIYSLGALLFWLLTGSPARKSLGHCGADLGVSAPLSRLVRDMLATEPADRPSAREVADRFAALLSPPEAPWPQLGPGTSITPGDVAGAAEVSLTAPPLPRELPPDSSSARLGRFRLLEELGQGGQGVVYRAEDTADGSVVALKVLRAEWASHTEALRRFRKEARLLAEVNNPFVVNILEYNEDAGIPYLVLEFVAGQSLSCLLAERSRLDESAALAILADVARALTVAHERGIVHRDIKPANILFLGPMPSAATAEMVGDESTSSAGDWSTTSCRNLTPFPPKVKVSDFGLARHVVDRPSLAMTEPGAILGTPPYMAPEQCTARPVDPGTDVYAMGATLFHMLAGRPPFVAATRDEVYAMHCHHPPPPLEKFNPAVSDGVCRVVAKALAKAPEDRYRDAGAMLQDLERMLLGEPTQIEVHPRLPVCDPHDVLRFEFRWELVSSRQQLWPHVSNTERWNRAVGLPAPLFTTRADPTRGMRRFGELPSQSWEEHPFEWVEGRRMGVLREYTRGHFKWVLNEVELETRPGGGTVLTHRIRVEPRTFWVRVFAPWMMRRWAARDLARVYRRIDAALSGRLGGTAWVDPFEEPAELSGSRRRRLDDLLDVLSRLGVAPTVVEHLGDFLTHAPAPEVARIRPLALARRLGLDPDEVVSACLHGAHLGLLALLWDILCPACRLSCEIKDTLGAIREHGRCRACHLDFRLDFAHSVELVFQAHPEIRAADTGTYCIGGPAHSPHVVAQVRVAPGERVELDLSLPEGAYRLRGPQLAWSIDFRVQATAPVHRWDLDLAQAPAPDHPRELRSGGQVLVLTNRGGHELLVRVERTAPRDDALTAARATSLALFRELFPAEVLAPGQLASIATVTFLATEVDPEQADVLYKRLGDGRAFGVIHEHFRLLEDAVRRGGGALIKITGDGALAAFNVSEDAVQVGLGLQDLLDRGTGTRGLQLRAGIHRGPALAATLNDRLDYFGTTVRQAMGLLPCARPGELVLTREVAVDPGVAALLRARGLEGEILQGDLTDRAHTLLLHFKVPARSAEGSGSGG